MVNTVVQYPTSPHFFQPLLPGFDSHLNIPTTFISKHVKGRNEYKTVELRSDASDMAWEVKIDDGRILKGGWREFIIAHDLRIGDVLVFRHEGDLVFHVTALGPSCSEIQYVQDNMKSKSGFTKDCRKWKRTSGGSSQRVLSSLSESRFLKLTVTPSGLKENRIYLPQWFTKVNKMESARGKKITLLDKHGVEWPVNLRSGWGNGSMCLGSGIKQFLKSIGLKTYESFVLELVWGDKTSPPVFKFCSNDQSQDLTVICSQVVNKCELNS